MSNSAAAVLFAPGSRHEHAQPPRPIQDVIALAKFTAARLQAYCYGKSAVVRQWVGEWVWRGWARVGTKKGGLPHNALQLRCSGSL